MRNRFNVDSDEKQRIISLHENSLKMNYLNLIVEQAQPTWLKFPNDKTYEYLKKDNKWFTRRVGTTKEFDLSSNPKYKVTVDKLEEKFPGGVSPAGTTTTTTTASTQSNNVSQDFSNAISSVIQKVGGQEGLGNSISTVLQQFSQNPETKAIIDKLTASGVDISKLQPAQIIPTLKQYDTSGILKIDPKLIPSNSASVANVSENNSIKNLVGTTVIDYTSNPQEMEFGKGKFVKFVFNDFKNNGKGPITITGATANDPQLVVTTLKLPITVQPGQPLPQFLVYVQLNKMPKGEDRTSVLQMMDDWSTGNRFNTHQGYEVKFNVTLADNVGTTKKIFGKARVTDKNGKFEGL